MANEGISKDVFEVHMQYTKEGIEELKKNTGLIFHKLDTQEKTLVRNTITVEDHKRRSDNMEERQREFLSVVNKITFQLSDISDSLVHINARVDEIEDDIGPIKDHIVEVKKVTGLMTMLYDNKGLIGKVIMFSIVILSAVYYGFNGVETIIKAIK